MNRRQGILTILVLALVIISLSWIFILNNGTAGQVVLNSEPIKIGVIGHFSGEYASYGIPMKNAIELVVEETNNDGGVNGDKLVLVFEDDGADATKAASGMNKLINVDAINYILSAQGSGATSVITPIANSNSKILMITLGSAPDLTAGKNYVFRSAPSDVYQASKMVEYLNENLNPEKIAGIYRNDPYGIGIKDIIEKGTSANVVVSELYDPSSSDFRTQLTKIKQAEPDVLVIAGAKDNYPILLKQIKELGISATILTSETFYDQDVLSKSGKNNVEGIYTLFQKDPQDYVNFNQKYTTRFGEEPSAYSMYAYDGAMSLIKALKEGDNIGKVRANLLGISFNGASGKIGFNTEGDRTGADYAIYKVTDGNFIKL